MDIRRLPLWEGRYATYMSNDSFSALIEDQGEVMLELTSRTLSGARINALLCRSVGLLSYLEGGYADGPVSVYLRGGLFRIDAWDDRIYVYERDAPGNFNVPAYYGRGYWAALTAGIRCTRWMRAYFRASYQDCPWHAPVIGQRPGKWEIKLQLALRL